MAARNTNFAQWERKFPGAKVARHFRSRERKFQGAEVPVTLGEYGWVKAERFSSWVDK